MTSYAILILRYRIRIVSRLALATLFVLSSHFWT